MEKFTESSKLYSDHRGEEIELHRAYGDLEPYDIHEAESYFTGHKIYICRCIKCNRVIFASRENLLYGNRSHCDCRGLLYNEMVEPMSNFSYMERDLETVGASSPNKYPYKPSTKAEFEKMLKESREKLANGEVVEVKEGDQSPISFIISADEESEI